MKPQPIIIVLIFSIANNLFGDNLYEIQEQNHTSLLPLSIYAVLCSKLFALIFVPLSFFNSLTSH